MLFSELINDGIPSVKLNMVQKEACKSFNEKLSSGKYNLSTFECMVCGKKDFEEIGEKDRYGLPYHTVICNVCGLIQSDQRLDQKSTKEFYNNEYPLIYFGDDTPSKAVFNSQYERGNLIYRFIRPFLPAGKPNSEVHILEIGCNAGGILKHFSDRGFNVTGTEINTEAVEYAKKYAGLDVISGTLESVNLKSKPDVIICSHVLEHMNDPAGELQLISKLLNDGGFLYIEVPGIKNLHESYNCNLQLYLQNAHTADYSYITLHNLLNKNGFEIIHGDEFIRCVCVKMDQIHVPIFNDKKVVLEYLRRVKDLKSEYPFRLFNILGCPKQFAKSFMKFTGLYRTFFRWYHMR